MQIGTVYSTVSERKTHIAIDTHYVGAVSSYNNFLTRFVANLLGLSIKVRFDDAVRSVNKKDYTRLLSELGKTDVTVQNVASHIHFRLAVNNCSLPSKGTMREAIHPKDSQALLKKLAEAVFEGNTPKALSMIGKGAAINRLYWQSHTGVSLEKDTRLYHTQASASVCYASVLIHAQNRGNTQVVERLLAFGANQETKAVEYTMGRSYYPVGTPSYGFDVNGRAYKLDGNTGHYDSRKIHDEYTFAESTEAPKPYTPPRSQYTDGSSYRLDEV